MRKLLSLIIISLFVMGGLVFADSSYSVENVTIFGPNMGADGITPPVEIIKITVGSDDAALVVGDVMTWGIQPQYTDGNSLGLRVEKCTRDEMSTNVSTGTTGQGPFAGVMVTISDSVQQGPVANTGILDDVLVEVFSYLNGLDLSKVSVVCRDWRKVANDERLWKVIFYRELVSFGPDGICL